MIKSLRITLSLLLASLFLAPQLVSAHVLLTSGNIGVVMHIDPDDDPIAGQKATFYLEFKDVSGRLDLSKCRCQVFITQGDKELYFETLSPISASAPLSSAFQFKFPAKGSYEFKIKGDPFDAGAFESFTLGETIAIERADTSNITTADTSVRWLPFVALGLLVFALAGGYMWRSRKSHNTKR